MLLCRSPEAHYYIRNIGPCKLAENILSSLLPYKEKQWLQASERMENTRRKNGQ